ncbi:helix-turn-helix domain-containing protein [Streptomyces sp. NPDC091292]|uniref:helix-turn-helix domain-containing protein n=1 Tax=Streptomyces sp. NPDC091292 TaxID=3365991 RepID=UPI003807B837
MTLRPDYKPVTDEEKQRVCELHAQNIGRNEIARQLGRAPRTISLIAAELELEFDPTMTEAATRARVAQLAALRSQLALDLTHDAIRLSGAIWEPATVYNFGGKDNVYRAKQVPEPPADAKRNLMTSAGIAIEKSLRLVPPETDTEGLAAVDAWLRGMMPGQ